MTIITPINYDVIKQFLVNCPSSEGFKLCYINIYECVARLMQSGYMLTLDCNEQATIIYSYCILFQIEECIDITISPSIHQDQNADSVKKILQILAVQFNMKHSCLPFQECFSKHNK